ncbi:unnamed protein product [Brugia timori]|uniref:Syntaxin-binding protein 2 n=1 Tax=Brugia timori TaxID=42155 RepID=A0A0R3QB77_9BILA|nr:unnamed protein product [Brugia timori]
MCVCNIYVYCIGTQCTSDLHVCLCLCVFLRVSVCMCPLGYVCILSAYTEVYLKLCVCHTGILKVRYIYIYMCVCVCMYVCVKDRCAQRWCKCGSIHRARAVLLGI